MQREANVPSSAASRSTNPPTVLQVPDVRPHRPSPREDPLVASTSSTGATASRSPDGATVVREIPAKGNGVSASQHRPNSGPRRAATSRAPAHAEVRTAPSAMWPPSNATWGLIALGLLVAWIGYSALQSPQRPLRPGDETSQADSELATSEATDSRLAETGSREFRAPDLPALDPNFPQSSSPQAASQDSQGTRQAEVNQLEPGSAVQHEPTPAYPTLGETDDTISEPLVDAVDEAQSDVSSALAYADETAQAAIAEIESGLHNNGNGQPQEFDDSTRRFAQAADSLEGESPADTGSSDQMELPARYPQTDPRNFLYPADMPFLQLTPAHGTADSRSEPQDLSHEYSSASAVGDGARTATLQPQIGRSQTGIQR